MASRVTKRPSIRHSRSVTTFGTVPWAEMRLARSHVSSGYYGTYLPLGHMPPPMFAPWLLGCRVLTRQRAV
jgi:hypothetical protein